MKSPFKGSDFGVNVLRLISGTTLAQVLPLLVLPLITRFYTPADFASLEQYMMLVEIFAVFATLKYEFAIMQPTKRSDAIQLVYLVLLLSLISAAALTLFGFLFDDYLADLFNNPAMKTLAPLIGVGVLLYAVHLAFNYWFSRNKRYTLLATTKVIETSTAEATKLGFGFMRPTGLGLVFGFVTGRLAMAGFYLARFTADPEVKGTNWDQQAMKRLAKEYYRYPRYNLWGSLFGRASAWAHVYLFSIYFSPAVGFIGLARRLVFAPLNIIASSFAQVFYQRVSEVKDPRLLLKIYVLSLRILASIALSTLLIILLLPEGSIDYLLGPRWSGTQPFVEVLVWWFVINFVSTALSFVNLHLQRQKETMWLDLVHLILVVAGIFTGIWLGFDALDTLRIFVAVQSIFYLSMIGLSRWFIHVAVRNFKAEQADEAI